jgi:5-(carboxyamino)imidazole ribonucleotide mutase
MGSRSDSLLSIVQMPKEIPVGTMAIGESGARNVGIYATKILALGDPDLAKRIQKFRLDLEISAHETVAEIFHHSVAKNTANL